MSAGSPFILGTVQIRRTQTSGHRPNPPLLGGEMFFNEADSTLSIGLDNGLSYTFSINTTATGLGLGNVNNTNDLSKPLSTATITALSGKVDKSQLAVPYGVATLGADGKIAAGQAIAAETYAGTWNASTNTPTLSDGAIPAAGTYYIVSTAGSTALGGNTTWNQGDRIQSNGTAWTHINAVSVVAASVPVTPPSGYSYTNLQAAVNAMQPDIAGRVQKSGDTVTGMLTLGNPALAAPTGLQLAETTVSPSKRAMMLLGSGWQIGQDSGQSGTKDLFVYNVGTTSVALSLNPTTNAAGFTGAVTAGGAITGPGLVSTASISASQAADTTMTLEDTSAAATSYRRKVIFSSKNVNSGNDWLFRQIRPSDGASQDFLLPGSAPGTIWTSGNFNPANYLPLTGGTLSGNLTAGTLTATSAIIAQGAAANYQWRYTGGSGVADQNIWDAYSSTTGLYMRAVNDAYSAANAWLQVSRSGNTITSVDLFSGSGNINLHNTTVVTGNLNASGNGTFGQGGGAGGINLANGGSSNSGYIEFLKPGSAARYGYVGNAPSTGVITVAAEISGSYYNFVTVNGATRPAINGSPIWASDNFNPGNYAALTGATFTGDITTYRSSSPGTGVIYFGTGGTRFLYYDGTNYVLNGTQLYINGSQAWHAGNLNPQTKIPYSFGTGGGQYNINGVYSTTGTVIIATDASGNATVTFPYAFPTSCVAVVACNGDFNSAASGGVVISTANYTASNFIIHAQAPSGPVTGTQLRINFTAIGN